MPGTELSHVRTELERRRIRTSVPPHPVQPNRHVEIELAADMVQLLNDVWMERPPYSDRYHLFRLVAHLAKYWTAEFAVDTAKWAMEVHGGLGVLAEYGVERWLREAMILAIWEGTSHRQILDGLEVMERKQAHKLLFRRLAEIASAKELQDMESKVEQHLRLPPEEREALAEPLFRKLSAFTTETLARKFEIGP
jgi:acyl-CoA dehydrogenase